MVHPPLLVRPSTRPSYPRESWVDRFLRDHQNLSLHRSSVAFRREGRLRLAAKSRLAIHQLLWMEQSAKARMIETNVDNQSHLSTYDDTY